MDWIKWLIPLIALAVYILSNMAKEREETRRPLKPPLPPPLPPKDTGERPKRSPSEVDRFLEEVRRRREEAARPPASKPVERLPERPPVVEKPTVVERPRQPRPAQAETVARPRPDAKETRRPAPAQPAIPVLQLAPLPGPSAAQAPTASAPSTIEEAAEHLQAPPARAVSPAAQQLLALLKTPQTLRTAFLLREVFDRPRCRRPQR